MTDTPSTPALAAPLRRHEDWPERLDAFLRARRAQAFLWGRHDCALFAAFAVEAMSGSEPAAAWRAGCDSAAGALRALRAAGHADLASAVTAALGAPLENPLYARRGDVATVAVTEAMDGGAAARTGFPHALGIVIGRQIAVVRPGLEGLGAVPLLAVVTAWRV